MTALIPAYPELLLIVMTLVIMTVDLFLPDAKRHWTQYLSVFTLLACAALSAAFLSAGTTEYTFSGQFVNDPMANLLKLFSYLALAMVFFLSRQYIVDRGMYKGEFYTLSLFALLGQMVMISANSFVLLYVGLEMMSLSLYGLVALRRDHRISTEAAMKYFVLGALASGFLLYGISMLYGATASLDFADIVKAIQQGNYNKDLIKFGLVFIIAGLAFKLGIVPFHMWVPDVYQGAPTPVTLLIGAAPKLATFAIALRILSETLIQFAIEWQHMLMVLAVLSLVIGNLVAIAQSNLKRMLAYSTISHMGFVLLGLQSGVVNGNTLSATAAYSGALFYILTYVVTTLGSFGVILLLARQGFEAEELNDLKGLNQRNPWYAFVMLILLFSLAGVPPTVGFYAKLVVLQAVVNTGHIWLAIVAVLMSLIGAFYYLRAVKLMYFDAPQDTTDLQPRHGLRIALSLSGIATLALGILPGPLLGVCTTVMMLTLGT